MLLDRKIEGLQDTFGVGCFSEAVHHLTGSVLRLLITYKKSRDFILPEAVVCNIEKYTMRIL